MSQAPDGLPRTLAEKIDYLFRTVHPASRGEYSNHEAAAAIAEAVATTETDTATTVSASYLYLLRSGKRTNPTMKHLEALASFFGVPPAYFFDDEASRRITEELETLAALRDAGVRSIALRASGLSPAMLSTLRSMVDRAREVEGLPSRENDDPPVTS